MQNQARIVCMQGPQQCSASFLQLLLQRLTDPNVAPITRSAAAAYLASFLARASFIPEPLLLETLQVRSCTCHMHHMSEPEAMTCVPTPLDGFQCCSWAEGEPLCMP